MLCCSVHPARYDPDVEKDLRPSLHPAWGFAAAGFYVTHAISLVRVGDAPHALWSCHLACLVLAAGILLRRPTLAGIALMWLLVGLPTWVMATFTEEGWFNPTSTLTHVFGLVLAAVAVRTSGMPVGTWRHAMAGLAALWILTRLVVPPGSNVNITRDYWFGWEAAYLSFPAYLAILGALVAGLYFGIEKLVRAIGWRRE